MTVYKSNRDVDLAIPCPGISSDADCVATVKNDRILIEKLEIIAIDAELWEMLSKMLHNGTCEVYDRTAG